MNSHLAGTLVALATLLAVYAFVFYALSGAVATR